MMQAGGQDMAGQVNGRGAAVVQLDPVGVPTALADHGALVGGLYLVDAQGLGPCHHRKEHEEADQKSGSEMHGLWRERRSTA
jgi:hypothetical protein